MEMHSQSISTSPISPISTASWASIVLSIPELLEAILIDLDVSTLLITALRVCRRWNDVIANSSQLQEALFFKPVASPPYSPDIQVDDLVDVNPLLVKKFGRLFFEHAVESRCGRSGGVFWRRASAFRKLPWCRQSACSALLESPREFTGEAACMLRDANIAPHDVSRRHSFTRQNASWRRMLVAQPPPPHIGYFDLNTSFRSNLPFSTSCVLPRYGPGVRMGDLYDLLQYQMGQYNMDATWGRVTWNRLHGRSISKAARQACEELLRETSVVLEIVQLDNKGHFDVGAVGDETHSEFNTAFRCIEFQVPNFSRLHTDRHYGEFVCVPAEALAL